MIKPYIAFTINTKNMQPKFKHVYYIESKTQGKMVISEMLESPGQIIRKLSGRYSDLFPINQLTNEKNITIINSF